MEFDFDGLLNACEGMIKRTRDDYIKGANRMMRIYGQVITEKEAIQNHEKYRKLTQGIGRNIIKHYTDARTFVERDPYCIFSQATSKEIFDSWNRMAKKKRTDEDDS